MAVPFAAIKSLRDGFLAEHATIETLLDAVVAACEAGELASAAERWACFRSALAAHLDAEDGLIAVLGATRTARVLVHEHRFIRRELEQLDAGAAANQLPLRSLRELGYVLRAHAQNDDRMLYALMDAALADPDRRTALEALSTRLARCA